MGVFQLESNMNLIFNFSLVEELNKFNFKVML